MKLNKQSLIQMKINKPIRNNRPTTIQNTLLIDGEYLLKQGFHGTKQLQGKEGSVGTIFHFINTIKRFYQDYAITKVVVFWEGENSKQFRQGYYPYYKANRNNTKQTCHVLAGSGDDARLYTDRTVAEWLRKPQNGRSTTSPDFVDGGKQLSSLPRALAGEMSRYEIEGALQDGEPRTAPPSPSTSSAPAPRNSSAS